MSQDFGKLVVLMALVVCGMVACSEKAPVTTPDVVSDTQRDIGHDHKHIHGSGQVHEHDHANEFEGAHTHEHEHGHRHGEPPHGGRIVQINAVAEQNLESHFHAEVMPISNHSFSFYLLTEMPDGSFEDLSIDARVIRAMASQVSETQVGSNDSTRDNDLGTSENLLFRLDFRPLNQTGPMSAFTCSLPAELATQSSILISIPELQIGGQPYSLSFQLPAESLQRQ